MESITITGLTTAQADALVGQNMLEYVASLANYLISKKLSDEKFGLIKVLIAKTPEEVTAAAKPILDAERIKAEALLEVPK